MKPLGPDSFNEATNGYRAWLGARITITDEAWAERQGVIAKCSPFEFLRATFYRWAQWWPAVCHHLSDGRHPNLDHAPQVLGVGDLHVENFGTWRDAESRLVWGINDFDEACCLPYTHDLVRLAASARFAIQERHDEASHAAGRARVGAMQSTPADAVDREFRAACRSLLSGYGDAIDHPGGKDGRRPFILAEDERTAWLRDIVISKLRTKGDSSEFTKFLASLKDLPNVEGDMPKSAWDALRHAMPKDVPAFRVGHRQAGLGSLGTSALHRGRRRLARRRLGSRGKGARSVGVALVDRGGQTECLVPLLVDRWTRRALANRRWPCTNLCSVGWCVASPQTPVG